MTRLLNLCAAAVAALLFSLSAEAAPSDELIEMINAYRASPPACDGAQSQSLPPLAPEANQAAAKMSASTQLQEALQSIGLRSAQAQAISLSGPADVKEAFQFATKYHCRVLLSPDYSVIGVSRKGKEWHIVLAQPLLDPDLGPWREAGQRLLKLVNNARTEARTCGDKHFSAVGPLRWDAILGQAALKHSRDMARRGYFSHKGRDGSTPGERASQAGYQWRHIGENIAAGQGTTQQALDSWLASPGHCANLMNGNYTEMGAAYAYDPKSEAGIYWTQVFGTPR